MENIYNAVSDEELNKSLIRVKVSELQYLIRLIQKYNIEVTNEKLDIINDKLEVIYKLAK